MVAAPCSCGVRGLAWHWSSVICSMLRDKRVHWWVMHHQQVDDVVQAGLVGLESGPLGAGVPLSEGSAFDEGPACLHAMVRREGELKFCDWSGTCHLILGAHSWCNVLRGGADALQSCVALVVALLRPQVIAVRSEFLWTAGNMGVLVALPPLSCNMHRHVASAPSAHLNEGRYPQDSVCCMAKMG